MKTFLQSVATSVAAFLATCAALASSPAETLEQGIYTEETKGDFPAAVQLYQQVITEAKANQALAAQAQYHLGLCYFRQHDFTNASAAFAALTRDYPDQMELAALARKCLETTMPLQPAPWQDGEDLRFDLKLPGGLKIGFADYTMDLAETNGQKIWRTGSHVVAGEVRSFSWVDLDADTFKPSRSHWMYSTLGDVAATYFPDHVDLVSAKANGPGRLEFAEPVIDNEECVQWMRRLPLAPGYATSAAVVASLTGRIINVTLRVAGTEKVTVPAGTFDCFKVEFNIQQTFWYSTDAPRYLVKFTAGGASAVLREISARKLDEPGQFQDPSMGMAFRTPPGWLVDEDAPVDGKASVTLVNADCTARAALTIKALSLLEPADKSSVGALADHGLKLRAQIHDHFVPRDGARMERSLGGHAAVGFTTDFGTGDDHYAMLCVFAIGATNAVAFDFAAGARDFDKLRSQFDGIMDSFQMP